MEDQIKEKKGCSILMFKPGDIIVRLKPVTRVNGSNGIVYDDNSFRGEPLEFVGIANNMIYVRRSDKWSTRIVTALVLSEYSEDWALFVVPDGLTMEDCI